MRPTGKEGFLYGVKFGSPITGSPGVKLSASGWYKIKSRASENSGIPEKNPEAVNDRSLEAGDVYFVKKGQALEAGDALIPMALGKLSFTTDVSAAAQGQAIDVTTQIDVETGARAYEPSAFKEQTGNINGYVDVDSDEQRELINEFNPVILEDGSGHITKQTAQAKVHHFMISYRESKIPGETEMWRYFPIIVESFQMDKPVDGVIPFNFNYRVDGKNRPCVYYRMVELEIVPEPETAPEPEGEVEPEEIDPVEPGDESEPGDPDPAEGGDPDPVEPGDEPEQGDPDPAEGGDPDPVEPGNEPEQGDDE